MYQNKRVLLIAGGGTLGTYTAKELLAHGASVDIICLEDHVSDNERLRYIKEYVSMELLEELFAKTHYDGIVNFIHYKKIEDYKPYHELLIQNTDHLIFLSSYRVYADEQHPVTEEAPRLSDVPLEEEFRRVETYALPKIQGEDFLRSEHAGENWTIVRPVISFSKRRFDLFMYSGNILDRVKEYGRDGKLLLPTLARNLGAGIDWAGNSGKLIANLLFKKETFGEAYTISSAQNLTWGEVADIYKDVFGIEVEWVDEETFIKAYPPAAGDYQWAYRYDRKFDRTVDNTKVLRATGLTKEDFISVAEGLRIERALAEAEQ